MGTNALAPLPSFGFYEKQKRRIHSINPGALTALTLLVAESTPTKKDQVVALITQILK